MRQGKKGLEAHCPKEDCFKILAEAKSCQYQVKGACYNPDIKDDNQQECNVLAELGYMWNGLEEPTHS